MLELLQNQLSDLADLDLDEVRERGEGKGSSGCMYERRGQLMEVSLAGGEGGHVREESAGVPEL
jgi:hypothetical protein